MVRKFDFIYRGLIGLLAGTLLWAMWASAQTNTGSAVIEFSAPLFTIHKTERHAAIIVKRSGNTNISCALEFATQDPSARVENASTRNIEQITFAPGIIERKIFLPVDDYFAGEGNRHVRLLLRNPTPGAALGNIPAAELEIQSSGGSS